MRFACFILSRYFENLRELKTKFKLGTPSESRNLMPFSYLPIEIAKIKPRQILSCQNREINTNPAYNVAGACKLWAPEEWGPFFTYKRLLRGLN